MSQTTFDEVEDDVMKININLILNSIFLLYNYSKYRYTGGKS